jgi:hypothetical protein
MAPVRVYDFVYLGGVASKQQKDVALGRFEYG